MMNSKLKISVVLAAAVYMASCTKQTVNRADEPTNPATPDTIIVTPFPTYNDTITAGDDNNMLLGNPTMAEPSVVLTENYLINQVYYIQSYSRNRGIPNWVSWHLEAKDATKGTDRQDDFRPYTGLPNDWYRVGANSYNFDVNKFDRGHNCPSADRISSLPANSATFYMTNMIPQAPSLNQGPWEGLEDFIRNTLVGPSNEAFIVMGNYGQGGLGTGKTDTAKTIDNGRITVPKMVWKVAVVIPKSNNDLNRIDGNSIILAVNMPNVSDKFSTSNKNDWRNYITTVNDLEANARLHGVNLNLLSNLNETVRTALKAKKYI